MWRMFIWATALALFGGDVMAQSSSTTGQGWSNSWGFRSATDRSVGLGRATAIRNAETTPGPSTVITYNTVNTTTADNRSNYVDVTTDGDVSTDLHVGDKIGQQTYAVGSLNTGTTTIDIEGDGNSIVATNSAENTGCIDGSALTSSVNDPAMLAELLASNPDALGIEVLGSVASRRSIPAAICRSWPTLPKPRPVSRRRQGHLRPGMR